jgi:hypothetical protein
MADGARMRGHDSNLHGASCICDGLVFFCYFHFSLKLWKASRDKMTAIRKEVVLVRKASG